MIIKNGKVLNDDYVFVDANVKTEGDKIEKIANCKTCACEGEVIDATDCYVVPGLVETHFHGALGKNFVNDDLDSYEIVSRYEAKNGTTSILPTLSAAPKAKLLSRLDYMKSCMDKDIPDCAKMYGVHLEGPFFAEKYKGAHLPENIRNTDVNEFNELVERGGGIVKIMTLAPELPNADDVIKAGVKSGVCISMGHTNATYEQALHAIECGVKQGTHLFNAMRPLNHRDPGTVGGVLLSDIKAEIICDFFHVHGDVVKMVYDIKGREKINMITDSEVGTGLPDGDYNVNGRVLTVKDKKTYTEDGTIAGGSTVLLDGVKNVVSKGVPLEDAIMMASKNPAETIGAYDKIGSLKEGKSADILVLDKELNLKHVIMRGKLLF